MAKPVQQKDGRWMVRVGTGEERTRLYADSRKAALLLAAEYMNGIRRSRTDMTVGQAIDNYINIKTGVLSPYSIRGYQTLRDNACTGIADYRVDLVDDKDVQRWISRLVPHYSPKTIRNAYGLMQSAVEFQTGRTFRVTLPQPKKPQLHTPESDDVQTLIRFAREHDPQLLTAILLAAFGPLRRGEICALTGADVDFKKKTIDVNKSLVQVKGEEFIKPPKTTSSYRVIRMPDQVMDELPHVDKGERLVPMHPNDLTNRFLRAVKKTDIEPIRFHDLRHYGASILHAWGVPDVYIMQRGGWSSDHVMKRIYREALGEETEKINELISKNVKL